MVLAFVDKRRKKIEKEREEVREEMRAVMRVEIEKARAEERAAWTAWNSRRIEAERRGEHFDEPPPSLNGR